MKSADLAGTDFILRPTTLAAPLWGIDLGGTKIEGALLSPEAAHTALHRVRVPTEGSRGYEHILGQVCRLVEQLEAVSGTRRPGLIGMGTPGTTEPGTGLLKNSNTLCMNGRPFEADLSRALGTRVRVANDANCFALAEATMGAAKGRDVVFGVILGTGVGGGVVVHGRILPGRHGIAGEWGHNRLHGETTPCYCGHSGCIETVCSGPALERYYAAHSGSTRPLVEIASLARQGDIVAAATLVRLQTRFAEAVAAVINILDPDAVVIGGGVGNVPDLYTEALRVEVLKHVFNPELRTEFLAPQLGDSAGVFGAALLAS